MVDILLNEAIRLGSQKLQADLVIPEQALGLVLFVHGSGSNRHSPRNLRIASILQQQHLATLLFDLQTDEELRSGSSGFDLDLAARRTAEALDWLVHHPLANRYPLGLLGNSTGAAAAMVVAAQQPDRIKALVLRGGRTDLAEAWLSRVRSPTLLIVGAMDTPVLAMNRQALRLLPAPKRMELVPDAGHLFEEPGALHSVAAYAASWFQTHFSQEKAP